jgi:type II secretory pathway pseudopilin PulG
MKGGEMNMRRQNGFTLIEVLVLAAILFIFGLLMFSAVRGGKETDAEKYDVPKNTQELEVPFEF